MGRNLLKISIVVLSLLIASASAAEALIQNGGFESGELAPWERLGENNSWTVTDEYSLEGTYSGFVQGTDQLVQAFEPRVGSDLEVFSLALMTAMRGTYVTIEIHYTDESNPTLVSLFIPLDFRWYAFDLLSRVDKTRQACRIVLSGHRGGDSPEHTRTWFDAITLQNNSPYDPVEPPTPDDTEVIGAETKRIKVMFNTKRPRIHLSLALRAEELPEGIHEGPVEITVLLSQDDFTTAFEAEAELVEVPHKKNHIIRLMGEGSADRVKRKH